MLFDRQLQPLAFTIGDDGYPQRLTVPFFTSPGVSVAGLEGVEANLSVRVTDVDLVVLTQQLRVVLTFGRLDDLPDPDATAVCP